MSQESGTSSMMSNLETQLANTMMVIQVLMTNIGNLTQQVNNLTQNVAFMQAAQNIPQPSPQPSSCHFPLPPSPQQQLLPHPSLFVLVQDHTAPMPSSAHIKEPKIANPLLFSGKRDDTKSFINSCCLYINSRKSQFSTEDAKIY